jgi:hypothetical protein
MPPIGVVQSMDGPSLERDVVLAIALSCLDQTRPGRSTMPLKSLIVALAILSMATGSAFPAAVKHLKQHRNVARVVAPPPAVSGARNEPRMIEAKPGVWVSTWEHVIDEGQGRWMVETREP